MKSVKLIVAGYLVKYGYFLMTSQRVISDLHFFLIPDWAQYVLCIRSFKTRNCSLDTYFWPNL